MNSHRQRVRRRTVTWQAVSLALLAGGIAVGALPIAGLLGPGKGSKPKDYQVSLPAGEGQGLSQTRVLRLKDAMSTIAPPVEVTAVAATEDPLEVGGEPEPPPVEAAPPTQTSWAYVGSIRAGGRMKLAIIDVQTGGETRQRTLSEGDTVGDMRLVTIEPDHIMVSVGGAEPTRINLTQRMENAVWAARSSSGGASNVARPRPMGGQPGFMSPAANAGMNPNAASNLAEAQRRMKAAIAPPQNPMASLAPPVEDRMTQLARQAKEMGELGQDKRDALSKILDDPSLSPEERGKLLSEIGIPMDATPDERGEYLHMIGVTPESDPKLFERLREGTGENK
jgi:hypothetical protein